MIRRSDFSNRWVSFACFACLGLVASLAAGHDPPPLPSNQKTAPSRVIQAEPIPASSSFPQIQVEIPPIGESPSGTNAPSFEDWLQPSQATSSLRTIGLLSILSLAPAIALMTTSYVRVAIVLTLLRQGLGAQGLPSNQMISALALFISATIMSPVWTKVYDEAIAPYSDPAIEMELDEALQVGVQPIRKFMSDQISRLGNDDDILLFYQYLPEGNSLPATYEDVPLSALVPAFMLSELKTAFLMGFQIYLPFLVLDILVASVTVSMGMFMLPPAYVSLPFKLLLFVMVDGWHLLVEMLLKSFVV